VDLTIGEAQLAIDAHQQPHRSLRHVIVERRRGIGSRSRAPCIAAAVGAVGKLRALLWISTK
jgi:hypothetical protein